MGCNLLVTQASGKPANDVLRMLTLSQRAARKNYKRQRNKQLKEWTRKRQVRGTKADQTVTYRIETEPRLSLQFSQWSTMALARVLHC
ncbi:hypothetical protein cypCar_00006053 [Cyprinus carpio]|nr:hypothetical protein cypCar_00006053 [Cyprinus carpio]